MSLSSPGRPTPTLRRVALVLVSLVLVAVIAVATVIAVASYRTVRDNDRTNAERAAALLVAEQFALRMDDFRASDVNAYQDAIEKLLTTKGKADFAQVKSVIGQVFTATQPTQADKDKGVQAPNGKIVYAGVSDIDSDSATVLVAHDTSVSGATKSLNFRWTVALKKIGGTWLVDGLPPEVVGSQSQ